jgi:hypothetical protein
MKPDPGQSEIEIVPQKDYILVKPPEGVNLWDIFMTLGKFIAKPEFQDKNDIWLLGDGRVNLNFSDLQKINDFLRENIPQLAIGKKSAIVVSTGFQRGLVETFVALWKEYPRKIRVFSDLKDAEEWVKE